MFKRVVDIFFIGINILSPLVGVVWFSWDIKEIIFLYSVEIGCITILHTIEYWFTAKRLKNTNISDNFTTTACLRLFIEGSFVIGSLTVFTDAVVGHLTTIFTDPIVITHYAKITIVPLVSLLAHYILNLIQNWQTSGKEKAIYYMTSLWIWLLIFPTPALIYSYILASHNQSVLLALLLLVTICKFIVEILQYYGVDKKVIKQISLKPTVIASSQFSENGLLLELGVYFLAVLGFIAVNPFTQDPHYSPTTNALMYLGFVVIVLPFLLKQQTILELDLVKKQIIVQHKILWNKVRLINFTDIEAVKGKLNNNGILSSHIFKIKNQANWQCSAAHFIKEDWYNWLFLLQQNCSHIHIPYLPKK